MFLVKVQQKYLTEETIEMSEIFRPIFQALAFGTDNNATTVDMMVAVMVYNKTRVTSSGNSFKICTCEINIEKTEEVKCHILANII